MTIEYERMRKHLAAGQPFEAFQSAGNLNDGFNYFWSRRPASAKRRSVASASGST